MGASPILAQTSSPSNNNTNEVRPLPVPTGNSRDLQGITAPKPQPRPSVQPRPSGTIERQYQIRPNQQPIDPETNLPDWKDQGEPRSNPGGVPLLNF